MTRASVLQGTLNFNGEGQVAFISYREIYPGPNWSRRFYFCPGVHYKTAIISSIKTKTLFKFDTNCVYDATANRF